MSEQNPVFLLKNDVEEILKGIYSVVLYDYFSERHETGLDHATWISLYDIGFPRGDFAEILRFGVTVDEASRLYDKLTEMVDYDDLETSRHEKWCLDRYNDYCHALAQDSLSLDQAFEVATRPAGRPYESALSDVVSLDEM